MNARTAAPACIVLAAGASRRMGRNKMLMALGGETIVHRAARAALDASLSPVVVVVGYEAARVAAAVADLPVETVQADTWDAPSSVSLQRGVAHLPPGTPATVLHLADMVYVDAQQLRSLVDVAERSGAPVAASDYDGVLAPPFFFRRRLFAEIAAWEGAGCGRGLYQRHAGEACALATEPSRLTDVDTPAEWTQAVARLSP